METRARHVLIGSFLLIMVAALFAFIVWMARVDRGASKEYDIYFRGGVTGLAVGSVVQYNGVPIGTVRQIRLVPDDPGVVHVRVRVDDKAPILEGTTAVLEAQGLTGISFVQLQGGYKGQKELVAKPGEERPVIPTLPSAMQSLFTGVPQMMEQASVALTRIGMVLNEENRKNLAGTLNNLNAISRSFANKSGDIENALASLDGTMTDLRAASQSVKDLAQSSNTVIAQDLPPLMHDLRGVAQRMRTTADNLDNAVGDVRPGLQGFSDTTVPELNRLISDLRTTSRALQTATEKFDGGGASAFFGSNKVPEYDPEKENK